MAGNILQLVLVEGPPDQRAVDHNQRLLMFGRPAVLSPPFVQFLIAPKRPPPELFFDTWVQTYDVVEVYEQRSVASGLDVPPFAVFFRPSNRLIEDEWPYPKTDHSLLHQFRWIRLGFLRGYTFEVPDLNDYPWLEWPVDRTDKGTQLFPFRQFSLPSASYQPSLLYWHSRNWDQEAERDIDRNPRHAEDLLLFGHLTPFTPIPQAAFGPFVMLSMWRTDESVWMASTINVSADGADLINGGAVTADSGLRGDTNTKPPPPVISVKLPL